MLIKHLPKVKSIEELPDPHRESFLDLSDEEIVAIRQRYDQFERAIFSWSHKNISLERVKETAGALVVALNEATKTNDKQVIFCPWIFEAMHTMSEYVLSPKDIKPPEIPLEEYNSQRFEVLKTLSHAFYHISKALVNYISTVYPLESESPGDFAQKLRKRLEAFFKPGLFDDVEALRKLISQTLWAMTEHGIIYCKNDIYIELMNDCLTQGWPNCTVLNDPDTIKISEVPDDIYTQMLLNNMHNYAPPTDEDIEARDKQVEINLREIRDSIERYASKTALLKAPGLAASLWQMNGAMYEIAQKAMDFRLYYTGAALDAPSKPLSIDFESKDKGSLFCVINDFKLNHLELVCAFNPSKENLLCMGTAWRSFEVISEALSYALYRVLNHDNPQCQRLSLRLMTLRLQLEPYLMTCQPSDAITNSISECITSLERSFIEISACFSKIEKEVKNKHRNPLKRPQSKLTIKFGKTMRELGAMGSIEAVEILKKSADEFYASLGDDTQEWPRQFLPMAAINELLWIISASEILKEELHGNRMKDKFGNQALSNLLNPSTSRFLPIFKRIAENIEDMNQGEYIEKLFGNLSAAGCLSHYYLGLSTSQNGLRLLPEYKDFWLQTFEQLFCAYDTKIKPKTTRDEAMCAYTKLEDIFRRLSIEAEIQQAEVDRASLIEKNLTKQDIELVVEKHTNRILDAMSNGSLDRDNMASVKTSRASNGTIKPGKAYGEYFDYCNEKERIIKVKIPNGNNQFDIKVYTITCDLAWNVAKQFVIANTSPVQIENPRPEGPRGKPKLDIAKMFEKSKNSKDNRHDFYKHISCTGRGCNAKYIFNPIPRP